MADFLNRNLFESPTNYIYSKVVLFYIAKVVLKLYLDSKLQVNLVFLKYVVGWNWILVYRLSLNFGLTSLQKAAWPLFCE